MTASLASTAEQWAEESIDKLENLGVVCRSTAEVGA